MLDLGSTRRERERGGRCVSRFGGVGVEANMIEVW